MQFFKRFLSQRLVKVLQPGLKLFPKRKRKNYFIKVDLYTILKLKTTQNVFLYNNLTFWFQKDLYPLEVFFKFRKRSIEVKFNWRPSKVPILTVLQTGILHAYNYDVSNFVSVKIRLWFFSSKFSVFVIFMYVQNKILKRCFFLVNYINILDYEVIASVAKFLKCE